MADYPPMTPWVVPVLTLPLLWGVWMASERWIPTISVVIVFFGLIFVFVRYIIAREEWMAWEAEVRESDLRAEARKKDREQNWHKYRKQEEKKREEKRRLAILVELEARNKAKKEGRLLHYELNKRGIDKVTNDTLREFCQQIGLTTSGNKRHLIERLCNHAETEGIESYLELKERYFPKKKKAHPESVRSRHISQDVKDKVWNRDGGRCVACGSNEHLEFDHIIPFSKGGANSYRNLQLLCQSCNRTKSANIG